ncbi:MAG: mechanosensitive ion channel family protein [Spirochaetales bacterium]|nr:mechanosensitive ion channel family protein [Spirochaetales bacterium]
MLRVVIFLVRRLIRRRVTEQAKMLTTKVINYTGIVIIVVIVLLEFGVNLTPILGAAGILGLAIGIASQASLSNVISGLFLVSEKPFAAGDVITVGDKTGVVMSIDLLSVKIRTFDNLYIRVPNEKIVSGEVTNITRYPIRRMDFNLSVAYKENLQHVKDVLVDIAYRNPKVLDEPAPIIMFRDFADSGITLLFGVWFQKTDYMNVKNSVTLEIKNRFDEEGIEIPFPHLSIYAGSTTAPFPVAAVKEEEVESQE